MESNTKSEIGAPGERKRRHHQRSRNGCVSCKSSHMRCDEGKPICRNCLKYGRSCGYTRGRGLASDQPLVKASNEAPESLFSPHLNQRPNSLLDTPLALNLTTAYPGKTPMLVSRSPLMSAIGVGMLDPFNGFPIPLSANSNLLLDHFNNYRILLQAPVRKAPGGDMFAWAVSDAALLHATLILTAKHWISLGGSRRFIESTLYQHKSEAIRLVNERLADPLAAVTDGTVSAVGILVILECLEGSNEAALVHLGGLEKMVHMRGDLHTPHMNGLAQRIILLADIHTANANNVKPRFQRIQESPEDKESNENGTPPPSGAMVQPDPVIGSFYRELGLDAPLIKMFTDLHWLSSMMSNSARRRGAVNANVLNRGITEAEKYIDTMLRGGRLDNHQTTKGIVAGKAFVVLSGYIYLYLLLRRIEVSSRIYDWMVDLLKEDLKNIQHVMRKAYPPELLFWILFLGASASIGRRELEWFKKELLVGKESLGLSAWSSAKAILMKFSWVEGWNEEASERFWNELN